VDVKALGNEEAPFETSAGSINSIMGFIFAAQAHLHWVIKRGNQGNCGFASILAKKLHVCISKSARQRCT
jgi:hypothetical protein